MFFSKKSFVTSMLVLTFTALPTLANATTCGTFGGGRNFQISQYNGQFARSQVLSDCTSAQIDPNECKANLLCDDEQQRPLVDCSTFSNDLIFHGQSLEGQFARSQAAAACNQANGQTHPDECNANVACSDQQQVPLFQCSAGSNGASFYEQSLNESFARAQADAKCRADAHTINAQCDATANDPQACNVVYPDAFECTTSSQSQGFTSDEQDPTDGYNQVVNQCESGLGISTQECTANASCTNGSYYPLPPPQYVYPYRFFPHPMRPLFPLFDHNPQHQHMPFQHDPRVGFPGFPHFPGQHGDQHGPIAPSPGRPGEQHPPVVVAPPAPPRQDPPRTDPHGPIVTPGRPGEQHPPVVVAPSAPPRQDPPRTEPAPKPSTPSTPGPYNPPRTNNPSTPAPVVPKPTEPTHTTPPSTPTAPPRNNTPSTPAPKPAEPAPKPTAPTTVTPPPARVVTPPPAAPVVTRPAEPAPKPAAPAPVAPPPARVVTPPPAAAPVVTRPAAPAAPPATPAKPATPPHKP